MIIYAALAGALVVMGFVLFVAELTRRAPAPGTPPRFSRSMSLSAAAARRGAIALGVGLVLLLFTGWPVAGVVGAAAVIFLPKITGNRANKQQMAMLEGLEQWIRRLADMLTASRGLQDALEASARTAPEAVVGPVTALSRRLSARVGTEEALRAFADEINDPAGDRIAAALIIATGQRGGGVRGVLAALAEMLARDVAARREIEADRAEHRTTVRWIIMFVGGFTMFAVLNKSYSAPYGTLLGEGVLAMISILYAVGLTWLHKLGTIPAPARFLQGPQIQPEDTGPLMGPVLSHGQPPRRASSGYIGASYGDAGYPIGGGP
jgi:Flp pilus assembly protein TadB